MQERGFKVNLKGRVKNFNIPYTQSLVPLYEAIVNSMHAIYERREKESDLEGRIDIILERNSQETIDDLNILNDIENIIIKDNGIGFNQTNYDSFMTSDSEHKIKIGGKGVGRFSWLKVFEKAEIESNYHCIDECINKRIQFPFELDNIVNYKIESSESSHIGSTIKLIDMDKKYQENTVKSLDVIARQIIEHCIIYLLNDDCPNICISDEYENININQRFKDYMASNSKEDKFDIENESFTLKHIKINEKNYPGNTLLLCANDRLVESKNLEKYIPDLDKNIYEEESYWYIGILTGKYLDGNVDMNRLSFNIPTKESDKNLVSKISINGLTKVASTIIEKYLEDYLSEVSDKKMSDIEKYMNNEAPQYKHLLSYKKDEIKKLKPSLKNEDLDNYLYNMKRDLERESQNKAKGMLELYKKDEISKVEYRNKIEEELQKITSSNSSTLSQYILHRKVIIDLLNVTISKITSDDSYGYEKDVHNLIYPMKENESSISYDAHNLWLIDERLSYSHFISSDERLKVSGKRPDLLLMDNPVAFSDIENDGSGFNTITIFELKRPMRNDYTDEDNPIKQILNYVKNLRTGEEIDSKGRRIKVNKDTKFYLYAICDIEPSLEPILEEYDFQVMPDRIGRYLFHKGFNAYMEVLPYSKLSNDAKKRNKVLFDKLGIN